MDEGVQCPKNLLGHSFISRQKLGGGEELLCLSWVDITLPSSAPPPGWAGEISWPCMVKLGSQINCFSRVQRACLRVINSLSRMRISGHHCFIVCFCRMILLLSKPARLCVSTNLLPWVIIHLQGPPIFFLLTYNLLSTRLFSPLLCPFLCPIACRTLPTKLLPAGLRAPSSEPLAATAPEKPERRTWAR